MSNSTREVVKVSFFAFLYKIGVCPKCMRQSFIAATLSLALLGAVSLVNGPDRSLTFLIPLVIAIGLVMVWLLHVVVFGLKAASQNRLVSVDSDRRTFFFVAMRAMGVATVFTSMPGMALASGECGGRLNCGWGACAQKVGASAYCCPQGFPILNLCNCMCYQNVQGVIRDGCNSTGSCFSEF